MTKQKLTLRPLEARDRAAWDEMWQAYIVFYKASVPDEVTEKTWARILAPSFHEEGGGFIGLVALDAAGQAAGFVHALLHLSTWSIAPVCYIEDLFVRPDVRGSGAGRALLEAIAGMGRAQGWGGCYWKTADDNYPGRTLYDKVARRTTWIVYEKDL
ncbi:MAG: GNAT family N-acetyltransferase [Parvibaculaceae bacterium]|nr:GNAT family N-acetyltransferase [Parvibaculaceae bacterium]